MGTRKNIKTTVIAIFVLINSCTTDTRTDVAIVKNNLTINILEVDQPDEIITDSILYYSYITKSEIESKEAVTISIPGAGLSQKSNDENIHIYLFREDSLIKYKNAMKQKGMLKSSLIKKIDIQLNQIRYPLDTIYIR